MEKDAAILELLASYEEALTMARRANRVALGLADAHLAKCQLPAAVVEAYAAHAELMERTLEEHQLLLAAYRGRYRAH